MIITQGKKICEQNVHNEINNILDSVCFTDISSSPQKLLSNHILSKKNKKKIKSIIALKGNNVDE